MRLRWKFFLILLAFSLVPMVVVADFNRNHVERLGHAIAREGQALLVEIIKNELRQTAEAYSLVLRRSKSAMDFSLAVLATEAERGLAASALPLSPPGPARSLSGPDARLIGLAPTFALLKSELGNLLLSASVTLADGAQVSFPGRGGYPPDYDPRQRPWYRAAQAAFVPGRPGGSVVIWNDPAVDVPTGVVAVTLSKALAGPDGRCIGVASLAVPLDRILEEQELASQWASSMRTFLVAPVGKAPNGVPSLFVWAQRTYENHMADWKSAVNFERLSSDDPAGFAALLQTMERERSGVAELPYKGEDAFWAFARMGSGASFLVIVPKTTLAPLAQEAGREILEATNGIVRLSGVAMVVVVCVVMGVAFLSTRIFVRPLLGMIEAWKRLGGGDFSVRLSTKVGDERQSLVDAFNETVPILADHVRLQRSLELAQEVQRNLLPAAPPSLAGLDVAGVGVSCDETGGDYFDYRVVVREGERCLDAAVGDVTGHGVPSALLMATARALLLATEDNETPAARVSRANRLLCRDVGDSGRFMTLLAMEIRPEIGQARYVRAGHDPALLYDPRCAAFTEWPGHGLPLGIIPDYAYEENTMPFDQPGMVLALGTDGIWESRNPAGEMYGKTRFQAAVRGAVKEPAAAIVAAVLADLAAFRGGGRQEDDVTLVVIKKV